jgi:hypothetical protein
MLGCRADCGHRAFVEAYQCRRATDEARLEQDTKLLDAEMKRWLESNTMITFKAWLEGAR